MLRLTHHLDDKRTTPADANLDPMTEIEDDLHRLRRDIDGLIEEVEDFLSPIPFTRPDDDDTPPRAA